MRYDQAQKIQITMAPEMAKAAVPMSSKGRKSSMISDEEAVRAAFPEPEIETVPVKEAKEEV